MVMANYIDVLFKENQETIFTTTSTTGCIMFEAPSVSALRQAMDQFNRLASTEQKESWTSVSIPSMGQSYTREQVKKVLAKQA